MKHRITRHDVKVFAALLILSVQMAGCNYDSGKNIVLKNSFFSYGISGEGQNIHFTDRKTGTDYLFNDTISYCAMVSRDGKEYNVTSAKIRGSLLKLEFAGAGVAADLKVKKSRDRINIKVKSVSGQAESLTFLNVPLKLEAMPYEPFAACVLSMNLFTHVPQLPALQDHLRASCYSRFGMKDSEITLIGVPQKDILPVIRDVVKNAPGIPFSDKGGAWAQFEKDGYGSYLMDFGSLTEETVDETIEKCRSLGFNQVTLHGGGFFRHGELEPDRKKWPDGWQTFTRINDRLHQAGISSILLTYTFFIDKKSKFVTPVAHDDLGYFNSYTLAEPLGPDDDEITVKESTAGISMVTGYFVRNSNTLRVGGELLEYSGITKEPPYKFTGLKRRVNGAKTEEHPAGRKAYHLREMFGLLVPGPETPLFTQIAKRTAEIVDECGFDGIYFDAIDGNDLLGGKENAWYYGTKFVFEVARNLKKPVGMEMCDMPHHYWHYSSRWQAWDRPVRGYKRFIDVHLAASKSEDHRHGEWRGYTPDINRLAPAENGRLLLPLHLGWWANYTWNPPQTEPTFTDDIEYLGCKMIGNNAGLSMLGGIDRKTLDANPLFNRLIPLIKQYENLRHQNYFNDSIRQILRQPGKEFRLVKENNGKWNFKPVFFKKHKVADNGHPSSKWIVNNEFEDQPVKLRIEPLMSVKPFAERGNIILAGFTGPGEFKYKGSAEGVKGQINGDTGKGQNGGGIFTARSEGKKVKEESWIKMEKSFDPWLDLQKHQGLGVWIRGDGNGELLNLRIESPSNLSNGARGDHFIRIDFTGWRYFELVEVESSDFSNYLWPDEYFNVYNSYFYTVKFNTVDKLQLWYNNLEPGKEISCGIGPVKALPLVPVTIDNPAVTIGGETIVFPVKMQSGMFLEFYSRDDCKLYDSKGKLIGEVKIDGEIPKIVHGDNEVTFSCGGTRGISSRVQVTLIGEGEPL